MVEQARRLDKKWKLEWDRGVEWKVEQPKSTPRDVGVKCPIEINYDLVLLFCGFSHTDTGAPATCDLRPAISPFALAPRTFSTPSRPARPCLSTGQRGVRAYGSLHHHLSQLRLVNYHKQGRHPTREPLEAMANRTWQPKSSNEHAKRSKRGWNCTSFFHRFSYGRAYCTVYLSFCPW